MASFTNPPDLWQPFGAFSMVALPGAGQIVRLKGQVALDAAGEIVGPGDMRAQVRQVLTNIETAMTGLGGTMADIYELMQFTSDIEAFMACGDIRAAYFKPPYPVTTTLEVKGLYDPALLIEITAGAEIPKARFRAPEG